MGGKFTKDNQPSVRKGRGTSKVNLIRAAMKRGDKTEEQFYDLLVERAFENNDPNAFMEVLKRLYPVDKSTMPMVEFKFSQKSKPHEQAAQVMAAVADGSIPADIAQVFVSSISSMMKIEEITEISKRLDDIEKALSIDNG